MSKCSFPHCECSMGAAERCNKPKSTRVEGLDTVAEKLARTIWGYFKGGPEAIAWFDNNKSLGGPAWLIEQCRSQAEAIIALLNAQIEIRDKGIDALTKRNETAEADNAAMIVRVKELDDECNELVRTSNEVIGQRDHALNLCAQMEEEKEALETRLAAARKALGIIAAGHDCPVAVAEDALEDKT